MGFRSAAGSCSPARKRRQRRVSRPRPVRGGFASPRDCSAGTSGGRPTVRASRPGLPGPFPLPLRLPFCSMEPIEGNRPTTPARSMGTLKRIVIIAGPNGAGKTTFAREYLPREADCPDFVNVDLIAAGLSPFDPSRAALRAGRLMLREIARRVKAGESFAFETTLAGRQYARWIPRWRAAGYQVRLIFLWLPSVDLALARVAARVAQGGHAVPPTVVRRRFDAGWRQFQATYRHLVDHWIVYDTAGPRPVALTSGGNR